ncbi:MAG: type restriction enzyme, res subunit [Candidatus Berkelbacteria bacterium]|nr:type restriction enzyme, res subunit [Candidatus Berkelbacteria bacterium]
MIELTNQEKINLYQNLFRGRGDVFAVRWQSADGIRKGYTPVCVNEWKPGLCLKLEHGRCRDCANKHYAVWNDFYLAKHLAGQKAYGTYPLLADGNSYFLAVDFDGENWHKDALKFVKICKENNIKTYIERSNSGNGCHFWFFFNNSYPAEKSRLIFQTLLEKAHLINQFDKDASFDRIFPCQDSIKEDGLGNLIMLPLQGSARALGNTIFINIEKIEPFDDQWRYLKHIQKIETQFLDKLYNKLFGIQADAVHDKSQKLRIEIANKLILHGNNLPSSLVGFLKENLNFTNPEYIIKKRIGVSTYNLEKYFNLIDSKPNQTELPRGFLSELLRLLGEQNISYQIKDGRVKLKKVRFDSTLKLLEYQQKAMRDLLLNEQGILVASPGSGKTIIGLALIARLEQPTLILTHKRQIFNQWIERIESFLNIPKKEIGQICSVKKQVGSKITVAMIQTLYRMDLKDMRQKFGLLLVDECHHMPAKMFRQVITQFNSYYLYGLTATPERKYKDERLIFVYLGDILHQIETIPNQSSQTKNPVHNKNGLEVIITETKFNIPFKVTLNNSQLLLKCLIFDTQRNQQICADIVNESKNGSKCLVLTERKEHTEVLNAYLSKEIETIVLTGELTAKKKKERFEQIQSGHFQVLIATGQLLGEGTDISSLDCLFLVYPCSFSGKLTQYIGRITRKFNEDVSGKIYDYRDSKIDYLDRIFKRRMSYYKKNKLKIL